jgi:NADH-quinone oxidoreductase subunit J
MSQQIIFIILSVITLVSAVIVVTFRNLFHAALALMVSFLGVAGIYILLQAPFLGMAQLLVYIGAISILILFAIMMTRRMMQTREAPLNSQRIIGLVASLLSFVILAVVVGNWHTLVPSADTLLGAAPAVDPAILENSVARMGRAFVSADGYVLPFQIASVLLLAALIGAIYIAWPKHDEDNV